MLGLQGCNGVSRDITELSNPRAEALRRAKLARQGVEDSGAPTA